MPMKLPMEMEMEMTTNNSLRIRKDEVNMDTYSPDMEEFNPDVFEEEDENEVPDRSSVIQVGWAAAKKAKDEASASFTSDFKFTEDVQLIKFLSDEPMVFLQHWVQRPGKKSFIGWSGDPLERVGNRPERKFAFSVVNLTGEEEPKVQLMVVGVRLFSQLEKLSTSKATGPIHRNDLYWAVAKSGTGTKTTYSIQVVKERDLAEDWEIDPVAAAEILNKFKPLGPEALRPSTKSELEEIAREILAAQ